MEFGAEKVPRTDNDTNVESTTVSERMIRFASPEVIPKGADFPIEAQNRSGAGQPGRISARSKTGIGMPSSKSWPAVNHASSPKIVQLRSCAIPIPAKRNRL